MEVFGNVSKNFFRDFLVGCGVLGSLVVVVGLFCELPTASLAYLTGTGALWVLTGAHPCDTPIQSR